MIFKSMNKIDELTEYFKKFPGVGPKQANRFAYYVLMKGENFTYEISKAMSEIHKEIFLCDECFQFFVKKPDQEIKMCGICSSNSREKDKLLIVSNDIDAKIIEKSGTFQGLYFVLGGVMPILSNDQNLIRIKELKNRLTNDKNLKEIIIALDATPEGENTANILTKEIINFKQNQSNKLGHIENLKVSKLGRGLSTGSEIEYADSETLKNAFKNRF